MAIGGGERRWRGIAVVLAFAAAAAVAAATEGPYRRERERLDAAIRAEDWERATRLCESLSRQLGRERVARGGDAGDLTAPFYAELSARCAAASAATGDARSAEWLWHGALLIDRDAATAVAGELTGLAALPPLRSLGRLGAADPSREARPAQLLPRQQLPPELSRFGAGCRLAIELVVGADGRPRQPVIALHADCAPTQLYFSLRELGGWKFRPALRQGRPIDSLFTLQTTFRALPPRLHIVEGDGE